MRVVMGTTIMTIFLLGLIGFLIGFAFAKSAKGKQGHSVPHKQVKQEPDAKMQRQLTQLKQQLQSGLITKEEYQEKRNALLEK